MKQRELLFKRPVMVLQVFRMIHVYGKEVKSFADRKDKLTWKELQSKNGYVADGVLYLPASILEDKQFANCQLITIEDEADVTPQHEWKIVNDQYAKGNQHCFDLHHPRSYEIFRFRNNPLAVSLNYSNSSIGDPSRDNFTLATLEKDKAVEVKINGKHDTSRGRYYKEQSFIFHLLGEFSRCCFLTGNHPPVTKHVPAERKLVDLVKPLW
jgi:hypothetical protein